MGKELARVLWAPGGPQRASPRIGKVDVGLWGLAEELAIEYEKRFVNDAK